MAQNLDPNSDGRGVLQFKTGLMSVIKVFFIFLTLVCQLIGLNASLIYGLIMIVALWLPFYVRFKVETSFFRGFFLMLCQLVCLLVLNRRGFN